MKLVLFEERYRNDLHHLLIAFSLDVFNYGSADVDMFIKYHSHIYLAIISGEVVGFTSFVSNDYYGMRSPVLVNTYLYIKPEHRRSKSMHLMSIQAGLVARDLKMPLEYVCASKEMDKISKKLNAKQVGNIYEYSLELCEGIVDRFKKKVRIK